MGVIRHPGNPNNPNWAILTDFSTSSSRLKPHHKRWLDRHVVEPLSQTNPPWVYLRGFASRNHTATSNKILSRDRVRSVRRYILENVATNAQRVSNHITGRDFVGESWSTGDEDDNSPRWRAVEVIVTPNRLPERRVIEVPEPTEMIRRRTRCWLSKSPTVRFHRGWRDGEYAARAGESLWRNTDSSARRRLRCDYAEVPSNFRVIMVRLSYRSWENSFASDKSLQVQFKWGLHTGNEVLFSDWFVSSSRRRNDHIITRRRASQIYNNVAQFLRARDIYYQAVF